MTKLVYPTVHVEFLTLYEPQLFVPNLGLYNIRHS